MLVNREKLINLGWILLWGSLATAWCWTAAHQLGPTFDEPFYVKAGLTNWHDFSHKELLQAGTMPLPAETQVLPLRIAEAIGMGDVEWREWLPVARMSTVIFVWILLWSSFRLGSLYGGPWGGRLAVALVACEPVLLGHASLATTDVAFAACLLALLTVFRGRRVESTWYRRLILPAIWVTITFLAKASALVYVPACLAVIELERLWSDGWRPWPAPATSDPEVAQSRWKTALMSMRDLAVIGAMGLGLLLLICPHAKSVFRIQIHHNLVGHGDVFLLGQFSETGFWYYFPAALAIKLTLPVFVLLASVLFVRPRYLMNGAIWTTLALLALTPGFHVQLGVRMVLPIAALALIGAASAFGRWCNEPNRWPGRACLAGIAAACVAWSLVSAWLVWPNGLCYTNELFGGTQRGHLCLSESNNDWGQGLKDLSEWRQAHDDAPLCLWYFGTDPACKDAQFQPIDPHSINEEELRRLCKGSYVAASTTLLYGYFHHTQAARYLRSMEPCAQTSTYLIYDFRRVD